MVLLAFLLFPGDYFNIVTILFTALIITELLSTVLVVSILLI